MQFRNSSDLGCWLSCKTPFLLFLLGLLLFASPAQANSGLPYTMLMLGLSFNVAIATLGLGWLAIVAVEAWGLWQRESVSIKAAIFNAAGMNLFSTLLGFCFIIPYAASGLWIVLLINSIVMGWIMAQFGQRLIVGKRLERQALSYKALLNLGAMIVSLVIFVIAGILNSGIGLDQRWHDSQITPMTYIVATLALLGWNFLLTWISESYWLSNRWPDKTPTRLCQTVFWINLRSYIYILLPTIIFLQRMGIKS